MKKITKEDFKKYMFKLLQTLIIGVCVGLVVGLYQLIVTNVATLSKLLFNKIISEKFEYFPLFSFWMYSLKFYYHLNKFYLY